MTLQAAGSISFSQINVEFGRSPTATISLGMLYRNGGIVGAGIPTAPTAGSISLGHFYGGANAFSYNPVLSGNNTNFNLKAGAIAAGWDGTIPLTAVVTLADGAIVGSSSSGSYAFDTGASFPVGTSLSLIIGTGSYIVGAGGVGSLAGNIASGGSGGPALRAQQAITIVNNGTIGGGGGAGGYGGGAYYSQSVTNEYGTQSQTTYSGGGGGGGGAGYIVGSGGAPYYTGTSEGIQVWEQPGAVGTLTAGGNGGIYGGRYMTINGVGGPYGGYGGAGGGLGVAGATGNPYSNSSYYYSPAAGGAAGAAVIGNSNITWATTGTRLGGIS
jgi:hypothetical protein